ncbi:MAG: hypothetical protein JKY41_10600, partial [Rhodobacteraceae bacterium]|nr:hypothetical protein [Paracoccaceae bacterium]
MEPEAKIWRDRLHCTVKKVDDIFEAALARAQDVLDDDGLTAWLAGADKVCAL